MNDTRRVGRQGNSVTVALHPFSCDRRWAVTLNGETLVASSADPEHDAARALLSLGITGMARTVDGRTGQPRMVFDIKRAARLRCSEESLGGLRIRPYNPDIDSPIRETEPADPTPLPDPLRALAGAYPGCSGAST